MKYAAMVAMMAATTLAAGLARGTAMNDVGMTLSVEAKDGRVLVQVELENRSADAVLVPRTIAASDRLLGRVFDVKGDDGTPVPYVGPLVKRGPLTAADYLALPAGQRHRHTIDIAPAYDFRPGTHTYTVAYAGQYITDAAVLASTGAASDFSTAGQPLAAPPVSFSYTK